MEKKSASAKVKKAAKVRDLPVRSKKSGTVKGGAGAVNMRA